MKKFIMPIVAVTTAQAYAESDNISYTPTANHEELYLSCQRDKIDNFLAVERTDWICINLDKQGLETICYVGSLSHSVISYLHDSRGGDFWL